MQAAEDWFDENGCYAENEHILLRSIRQDDREDFLNLYRVKEVWKKLFENPLINPGEGLWEDFQTPENLNVVIIRKKDDKFCGFCGLQYYRTQERPELSVELVKECQRQGIGCEALRLLMDHYTEITGKSAFISKVTHGNIASQMLMRKLGGKPGGVAPFPGISDELLKMMEEDDDPLPENVYALAEEFCVAPDKFRSHVLVFDIG